MTAGTVMHPSHLPLKVWFTAAWLVATHRNGMSARQLWLQLGLGSYKSAWLLLRKLRAAMVDPGREPLAGLVEVDETSLPFRGGGEPARPGRSHDGKLLIAGAVDPGRRSGTDPAGGDRGLLGREPGRLRRRQRGRGQHGGERRLVRLRRAQGRQARPEGGRRRAGPRGLPSIHRVFANAKQWALGVYHRLREEHLQAYLDEFVFRFNRRRSPQAAFARLLGLATVIGPHPYAALVAMGSKG